MTKEIVKRRRGRAEGGEAEERLPLLCRVRVDCDLPSLNDILRAQYSRHRTEGRIRQEWQDRLWAIQMEQLGPTWMEQIEVDIPHPRRRLEVIRRCRRELDRDGLYGGTKPILDALKSRNERLAGRVVGRRSGWFYDDSEKYLDLKVSQKITGEEPWLELSLYGKPMPKAKKP